MIGNVWGIDCQWHIFRWLHVLSHKTVSYSVGYAQDILAVEYHELSEPSPNHLGMTYTIGLLALILKLRVILVIHSISSLCGAN
jgi:hypothetical protein